jgi:hypothetical protein
VFEDTKPGIGGVPLTNQTIRVNQSTLKIPQDLIYERKAVKFDAYFEEPVHNSNIESQRIRRCIVYYHFEDGSINILEPKVKNSGLPQGILVKRHKIPKGDNEFFGIQDLQIGNQVTIYGKTFTIVDADPDTRVDIKKKILPPFSVLSHHSFLSFFFFFLIPQDHSAKAPVGRSSSPPSSR